MVNRSWLSFKILTGALKSSLLKLDPRFVIKNPVVFILYLCFIVTALVVIFPSEFSVVVGTILNRTDYAIVAIILFFTIEFSFFSESLAEAQGRAQADSLRKIKKEIMAKVIGPGGAIIQTSSTMLKMDDVIILNAGDHVPSDGSVIKGSILLDESMMTGESEPVLRESGGDRSSVLGGAKVLSGTAEVKITSEPGKTFLDRIIRLVEGAERQKTPNEVALTVLLVSLTIVLLVVVVSIVPIALYYNILLDIGVLIALFVCLMPTTIGGLLPAIGIAGVNRVTKVNIIAKSGRAVEAAGDIDVLILDKTGTLTIGNRYASLFNPAPGRSMDDIAMAAMNSSLMDETPEGRSIVTLAKKLGYNVDESLLKDSTAILFTPETRASGLILKDGTTYLKGSVDSISKRVKEFPDSFARTGGRHCKGRGHSAGRGGKR